MPPTPAFLPPIPPPLRPPSTHPNPQNSTSHLPLCTALPPKRIAAVAADLKSALQTALQARQSRLSIQLPSGAKLATEVRPSDEPPVQRRKAGDRELARLLAALFEDTGLMVRVVFPTSVDMKLATKLWGSKTQCQITTLNTNIKKTGRRNNRQGGGRKQGGDIRAGFGGGSVAGGGAADVFVMVGGGAAMLEEVRRVAQVYGRDVLIVVANANSEGDRVPDSVTRFLEGEFVDVYHYQPDPHPRWKGGVLFRKFPEDWVLCRLAPFGVVRKLVESEERPGLERIAEVLQSEERRAGNSLLNRISTLIGRDGS